MKIKQFIKKSIKGGWKPDNEDISSYNYEGGILSIIYRRRLNTKPWLRTFLDEQILLDPKAWEAVGKVEGWKDSECWGCGSIQGVYSGWEFCWHKMLDALAEGKTLEEFIETL